MYVPCCKSADDVTIQLSLRHQLWSITISVLTGFIEKTVKVICLGNHIFLENLKSSC